MFRRKVRQAGWYIKKPFAHFDLPLSFDDARAKVTDPDYVKKKPFWPFIGFVDKKRRFGKIKQQVTIKIKERKLRYCSHQDGYIYSFYAAELNKLYEAHIRAIGIDRFIIGYRRGIGTNIHMASTAFDEILVRGSCTVIAIDIESFFESIDHAVLKESLCKILNTKRLSPDWFAIYKSITR
jgi:hypothetical protein